MSSQRRSDKRALELDSLAVAAGRPGEPGEPVNRPVAFASTYRAGGERVYAREGNPTWDAFEAALGALEGGTAVAFGSGMGAAAALLEWLPAGARVVVSKVAYHGVIELVDDRVAAGRLSSAFVNPADHDEVIGLIGHRRSLSIVSGAQARSAGLMSVWANSLPLKSRGAFRWRASA